MKCHEVRDRLVSEAAGPTGPVGVHLGHCPSCARFAERASAARELLRDHHAGIEPDAHFASRVAARLNGTPAARLGWAAARLLPATVVLLFVLAWLSWQTTSSPASMFDESPTEDLLTWVIDRAGQK